MHVGRYNRQYSYVLKLPHASDLLLKDLSGQSLVRNVHLNGALLLTRSLRDRLSEFEGYTNRAFFAGHCMTKHPGLISYNHLEKVFPFKSGAQGGFSLAERYRARIKTLPALFHSGFCLSFQYSGSACI